MLEPAPGVEPVGPVYRTGCAPRRFAGWKDRGEGGAGKRRLCSTPPRLAVGATRPPRSLPEDWEQGADLNRLYKGYEPSLSPRLPAKAILP